MNKMNKRKKIIVVDDEEINLEFFEVMLSKLGFIVEKASDGLEAIEKLKTFFPDLIILDNVMPRMSGWELTKLLKKDLKYSRIPIIMLSALDDVKDKVEGFELGVDDYITKPFNFSEVLARIRAVLRNHELFAQIAVRESRLNLAEALSSDMKNNLTEFIKNIDALDASVSAITGNSVAQAQHNEFNALLHDLSIKMQTIRRNILNLDVKIEKTMVEWNVLKKNEIGLSALENQIRKSFNQG
ncbi:response regulator transcription factor [Breznakiellaceae bacterium SP9]